MNQSTLQDYLNLISLSIIKTYATIITITLEISSEWTRVESCQCRSENGIGHNWNFKNWIRIIIVECIRPKYRKNCRTKVPWDIIIIACWSIVIRGDAIIIVVV
jgi:hypothetical protein